MLSLTDADIESILKPDDVIGAIRSAFQRGFDNVQMPARFQLETDDGVTLIMPCTIAGSHLLGAKVAVVRSSPASDGRVKATYFLTDTGTGGAVAVLAANYLTDIRTAATSAVATDSLARKYVSTLGIFGTGRQAEAHVAVLSLVRSFARVLICGSTLDKAKPFAARMRERYALEAAAVDAITCASNSDVICTCTTAISPLFPGDVVRPGTHLNLVGTFQPHAREVDSQLICRAKVFVDDREAALAEAGDILVPLRAGEITADHIRADLHQLLSGQKVGRSSQSDITVFKSVGLALEDFVTAELVLPKQAPQKGSGEQV
jgi:ornithine cyclodeaminase/alanine dehydrogenase-like protein (mu-crystallin family)